MSKENKAEARPVVVGDLIGNDWFITEGLKAGEPVVVAGGLTLRPDAGRSRSPPPQPAQPAPPPALNAGSSQGPLAEQGELTMFSKFFIERPIFATVISLIIVIAGLVSMKALPVAQYPTITPVQIQVTTTYPGADSKTVGDSVAAPIEAQINGVDNMLYMTSTSSNTGQMTITVYFSLDTDPDIAQVQVQNRVNLAMPQLPEAVKTVRRLGAEEIIQPPDDHLAVQQGRPLQPRVRDQLHQRLHPGRHQTGERRRPGDDLRCAGPGHAHLDEPGPHGLPRHHHHRHPERRRQAERPVRSRPGRSAAQGRTVQLTFPVVTQSPFVTASEYENIILRASQDGSAIVRVKDVARAEIGRRQYIDDNRLNGIPATPIIVYQQPGANGLEVSNAVRKTMEDLKKTLPDGIEYAIALDTTDFVRLSIEEVIHTLFEAILLVVLVVYLFLQSFRATIICTVAIFVSLIGTFAGMLALGFSINLLTLFGIVLAIGMVVDDAIVVVENVERNMVKKHLPAKEATIMAMEEIGTSLIAVVLVMASVFIPAAFLPGTTGQLYKQFAITIVISVALSGFVALTLTPAMCAIMLKHTRRPRVPFFAWFNRGSTVSPSGSATPWCS